MVHDHGTEEGKGLSCRETLIEGKLTGECLNYYKPWTSDEEPKAPENYGVGVYLGCVDNFNCDFCHIPIPFRGQYVYSFTKDGTVILHNTEECTNDLRTIS